MHGVYGDKGCYAIYPTSKQRFAGERYSVKNDKLTATEFYYFWFKDRETKSEIDLDVAGIKASQFNMNFYLTEKGEQPPTIQIDESGDDAYQITLSLNGEIVGEGSIGHIIQIITVDDARDYLSENLLFA